MLEVSVEMHPRRKLRETDLEEHRSLHEARLLPALQAVGPRAGRWGVPV